MFNVKDEQADAILNRAFGAYEAKFDTDLPILKILQTREIDVKEAQRIFDYVKSLKEPLEPYDNNVIY